MKICHIRRRDSYGDKSVLWSVLKVLQQTYFLSDQLEDLIFLFPISLCLHGDRIWQAHACWLNTFTRSYATLFV